MSADYRRLAVGRTPHGAGVPRSLPICARCRGATPAQVVLWLLRGTTYVSARQMTGAGPACIARATLVRSRHIDARQWYCDHYGAPQHCSQPFVSIITTHEGTAPTPHRQGCTRAGTRGDGVPPFFRKGGGRPPLLPHFFGLKFVQNLVHCCNCLLTETQCKIISVQQN